MSRDVFVSYAHEDQAIADKVRETLEAADVKCWISSRDELPGEDWAEMIVRGMDESKIIVFIHTARSNNSDACAQELAIAHEKRKFIIPVRVENVELSPRLQYRLVGRQRIDALTLPIEAHLNKLIDAVRGYIARLQAEEKRIQPSTNMSTASGLPEDVGTDQVLEKSQQAQEWVEKAAQLLSLALYPDALKCYDRAIKIDPHDAGISNAKGLLLTELGRHEEALRCFEQAASFDPTRLDLLKNKGRGLHRLQRFEDAVQSFNDALDVDPTDAETRALKCSALHELKRDNEALVCCEAAAKLEPDNPTFWYDTAICYWNLGKNEESLENVNKALDIDPTNIQALMQKGTILSNLARDEEAIVQFDSVLAIDPKCEDAWHAKGMAFVRMESHTEAAECFSKVLEIAPSNEEASKQKTRIQKQVVAVPLDKGAKFAAEGRHGEALGQYYEVIKQDPQNVDATYGRGVAFFALNDEKQAMKCFERVLSLDPQHAGALEALSAITRNHQHQEEAQNRTTKRTEPSEKLPDVKEVNDPQTAQHSAKKPAQRTDVVVSEPYSAERATHLAEKARSRQQTIQQVPGAGVSREIEKLEEQTRRTPEQAPEFTKLGLEAQKKGDLKNARVYFEKALASDLRYYDDENSALAVRYNNLGTVLRAMGDLKGARTNFKKALTIDEVSYGKESQAVAKDCNKLGMVSQAQGDHNIAHEYYNRALTIYQKSLRGDNPRITAVQNNIESLTDAREKQ